MLLYDKSCVKLHEKYGLIDTKSAETVDIDISMVTNSNITTFHELLIKFMKKSIVYDHDSVGKSIMNEKFALISFSKLLSICIYMKKILI